MTNRKVPHIVGIGEVVFDILPDSRKLGGAPADFLRYAVEYGAEGYLISAIGADDLGREVISELHKFEITPVLSVTPYPTGRVLVFNNQGSGYTAHILENSAWDYIPYTTKAEQCIKDADALYFDTLALRKPYSRDTILDLIGSSDEKAYRFFDINLRQNYYDKNLIIRLLGHANILKLNIEELKTLKPLLKLSGSVENMCLKLKEEYQLKYIILSDAAKESRIWGNDTVSAVKNARLHQTFAYGAGNAFAGTFMCAILKGEDQQSAHEAANAAAVRLCQSIKNAQS